MNQITNVIVDLDALLDTRAATLLKMKQDSSESDDGELFKCFEGYWDRDRDVFPGIKSEDFKTTYRNRDKQTLFLAQVTSVFILIMEIVKGSLTEGPFKRKVCISVNLFPYRLSNEEIDLIQQGIAQKLSHHCDVKMINKSLQELSPSVLRKDTLAYITYDAYEWLEIHAENKNFEKQSCPATLLIAPLLIRKEDAVNVDLKEYSLSLECLTKPYIDLQLYKAEFFSVYRPKQKEKEAS